jgi:hypothetical protein
MCKFTEREPTISGKIRRVELRAAEAARPPQRRQPVAHNISIPVMVDGDTGDSGTMGGLIRESIMAGSPASASTTSGLGRSPHPRCRAASEKRSS